MNMRIIGITGGVGCGKSEVLKYMKSEFQADICQLDEVAKLLEKKGTPCYLQILKEFGTQILERDGELDRRKLGAAVFKNPSKLQKLNSIVHPEVKKWVLADIRRKKTEGKKLYVIEAALLLEGGYEEICDEIWYIYAPEDVRRERLTASRGYRREQIQNMFAAQLPEAVFRKKCAVIIDNSGPFENTKRQIGDHL